MPPLSPAASAKIICKWPHHIIAKSVNVSMPYMNIKDSNKPQIQLQLQSCSPNVKMLVREITLLRHGYVQSNASAGLLEEWGTSCFGTIHSN